MTVKAFTFGLFQTNTYVVSVGERIFLIDPACSSEYERQTLQNYIESLSAERSFSEQSERSLLFQRSGLTIVATHGHLDHLWGAKWATEHWHTPVLMHDADIPMAQAMQDQYDLFGIPWKAESFPVESLTAEGGPSAQRSLLFQRSGLSIVSTPGHTPGSVCLYWPEEKTLLSGDTLFCMGFGRTDLPGGNYGQLIQSLNTLFALPSDVIVYPGHGESTTIGAENRAY